MGLIVLQPTEQSQFFFFNWMRYFVKGFTLGERQIDLRADNGTAKMEEV